MGFLKPDKTQQKTKDSAYFDATEDKVAVRPGQKAPTGVWVHQVHQIEETGADGQKYVVRRYQTELCTSTGRNGAGCRMCSMKDPLWDRLAPEKRTNKKGQRADFPKRVIHIMPVKNHRLGQWQILKGGNQVYEQMDQWYESQPTEELKDLRRCDWVISAEGQKMRKKYSSTRLDATPYSFTHEDELEVQRLMKKAHEDLAPRKDEDFKAMINGDVVEQTQATAQPIQQTPWNATAEFAETAPQTYLNAPVAQPPPQPPVNLGTQSQSAIAEFSAWLNEQPEFKGTLLVQKGIPIIKEFMNGGMNYYTLSAPELANLKAHISRRLAELRIK